MTEALCLYAIIAAVPVIWAERNFQDFLRDEVERDLERRIAEDDEPVANDNDGGDA